MQQEISSIASEIGIPESEIMNVFKDYRVLGAKNFSKEASKPESEPEWYINTFIRHNLPFLYQQGIIESNKPSPKVSVVKNALKNTFVIKGSLKYQNMKVIIE